MKKNLYSRNEIVDAALLAWDEPDMARDSVYKQVERILKENDIEAGGKKGRTLLYPIDDLSSFVREKMFDYFMRNKKVGNKRLHAAKNIGEDHLNELRGRTEDYNREGYFEFLETLVKGNDHDYRLKQEEQNNLEHKIEESFIQKKYQIMLEALFNEKFVLMSDMLKQDIRDRELFLMYGDLEEIKDSEAALIERYDDATSYYREKSED